MNDGLIKQVNQNTNDMLESIQFINTLAQNLMEEQQEQMKNNAVVKECLKELALAVKDNRESLKSVTDIVVKIYQNIETNDID